MNVHLIDGTFELFRSYYGAPASKNAAGVEIGATRGLLRSFAALLREPDCTHIGVAFDHVIESFRNGLFDGYKTGGGIEPELRNQFGWAERAADALGIVVWPMVEFEADDALAAAAYKFRDDPRVDRVFICTPDKDLAQCIRDPRVVSFDRIRGSIRDEAGVREKFGVEPASIPDWLALVGDTADGIPGIPRWGAKSAATVLAHYGHIQDIPDDERAWAVKVRGAPALAANLRERRDDAMLYKKLATLRTDVPLEQSLDDMEWRGARRADLEALCAELGESDVLDRISLWQ
jgi:5'-3' exonuclease